MQKPIALDSERLWIDAANVVAILPILLYIGMLIGSQAFQESPRSHAPAIILAMMPQIAAWGKNMIDGALGAAGTNAAAVGLDKLGNAGVLYHGLATLGGGATLSMLMVESCTPAWNSFSSRCAAARVSS